MLTSLPTNIGATKVITCGSEIWRELSWSFASTVVGACGADWEVLDVPSWLVIWKATLMTISLKTKQKLMTQSSYISINNRFSYTQNHHERTKRTLQRIKGFLSLQISAWLPIEDTCSHESKVHAEQTHRNQRCHCHQSPWESQGLKLYAGWWMVISYQLNGVVWWSRNSYAQKNRLYLLISIGTIPTDAKVEREAQWLTIVGDHCYWRESSYTWHTPHNFSPCKKCHSAAGFVHQCLSRRHFIPKPLKPLLCGRFTHLAQVIAKKTSSLGHKSHSQTTNSSVLWKFEKMFIEKTCIKQTWTIVSGTP